MRKHTKKLILFLLISFLLPLVSLVSQTLIPNNSVRFVLYGIQAASPTISAIVVLCLNKEVRTRFKQIFRKERLRTAVILPITIACVTMFPAKLIYCVLSGMDFMPGNISAAQFIIILWAFVAEEIGWRGYLEPLLKTYNIPEWIVPGIVGMIWCLWHYHFFLQGGIEIPIPLFFISCIIESYIYSFVMSAADDNMVSAMTYHFMWNLLIHLAAINPVDNNGSIFPYIILVVLEAIVLFVFLVIKRYNNQKTSKGT